jgi:heptaprenyl diphosphate synthase
VSEVSFPANTDAGAGLLTLASAWSAVYEPVRTDLALVAARVVALSATGAFPLGQATAALAASPGKLLRPVLVLLTSLTGPPLPSQAKMRRQMRSIAAAAAFELLHLASLIHDDILDKSPIRRGLPSVWGQWGTGIAVLAGDHLYGKAMAEASRAGRRVLRCLGRVSDNLLAGEAMELTMSPATLGLRSYMTLATAKTAAFCAESCAVGAMVGWAGPAITIGLRSYGRALGQAYQLTDDLLDLRGDPAQMGKPALHDIARGRLTFPTIVGLSRRPVRVGKALDDIRRAAGTSPEGDDCLRTLRRELEACGAFDETTGAVRRKIARAIKALTILPCGQPRLSLEILAENLLARQA